MISLKLFLEGLLDADINDTNDLLALAKGRGLTVKGNVAYLDCEYYLRVDQDALPKGYSDILGSEAFQRKTIGSKEIELLKDCGINTLVLDTNRYNPIQELDDPLVDFNIKYVNYNLPISSCVSIPRAKNCVFDSDCKGLNFNIPNLKDLKFYWCRDAIDLYCSPMEHTNCTYNNDLVIDADDGGALNNTNCTFNCRTIIVRSPDDFDIINKLYKNCIKKGSQKFDVEKWIGGKITKPCTIILMKKYLTYLGKADTFVLTNDKTYIHYARMIYLNDDWCLGKIKKYEFQDF